MSYSYTCHGLYMVLTHGTALMHKACKNDMCPLKHHLMAPHQHPFHSKGFLGLLLLALLA